MSHEPAAPETQDDQDTFEDRLLAHAIPWGISAAFHAGMVLLTVFLVWTSAAKPLENEVIVPMSRLSLNPGASVQHELKTRTSQNTQSGGTIIGARTVTSSGGGNSGDRTGGARGQFGKGSIGNESGGGGNTGLIGCGFDSIKTSPFGKGLSTAMGPASSFVGNGGNGARVVYLIDASGSLIEVMPLVVMELKRSIHALTPQHSFTVIFFQGSEPREVTVGPRGLKKITPEIKKQVCDWIDCDAGNIVPSGRSNPVKAIKLALSYQPDLIYLLSDNITGKGRYEVDQRQLLRAIQDANRGNTKINTIQYFRPDPLTEQGMTGTMELIANRSKGNYHYVDGRRLNIQ